MCFLASGDVNTLAIGAALAAAGGFAVSTALQQRSAQAAPATAGSVRLLAHLSRRPAWLAGMTAGAGAFALHGLAVRTGALALVQPLLVCGVVFALPVRAALDRRPPALGELGSAAITAGGIAVFVVAADPTPMTGRPATSGALALVGLGSLLALLLAHGVHRGSGLARGLGYGAAAGVLFGLVAGLLKLTVLSIGGGAGAAMSSGSWWSSWSLWLLVPLGATGLALNQRAYQQAPLSVSMPVLNVLEPLVAIAFGAVVLGERPALAGHALLAEGLGLGLMALGVYRLARAEARPSPLPGPPRTTRRPEAFGDPKTPGDAALRHALTTRSNA